MISILMAFVLASSAHVTFDQAKALADANEASLPDELANTLLKAQGNALGAAMASCNRPGMDLTAFTVVFSLNPDGSINEDWRQGETPLAECVHRQLLASGFPGAWPTPFYTSIRLSFEP